LLSTRIAGRSGGKRAMSGRTPTNFGPYEHEYKARVSRSRRLLRIGLQLALVAIGVILAGVFLFPMTSNEAALGSEDFGGIESAGHDGHDATAPAPSQ
jgi:hypothetical protein